MISIQCPSADELKSLSIGQLSEEESSSIFEHVRNCSNCQDDMHALEQHEDSLILTLRDSPAQSDFHQEADCQLAVARALGALGETGGKETFSWSDEFKRLPEQIGEYEVLRPLGHGGMGSVLLARHTKLGRLVALKILASHRLAGSRMRERFEQEMRAIGQLSHPNIVTAHDAREVEGTAVLVTEFIDGMDLGEAVSRKGALEVPDACEIARLVAEALEYTGSEGFVHRDVKPSNIMLSEKGEVKLLDLGLARLQYGEEQQTEITGTGQAMGTADYVAPEQVADSRNVDIRADLYSLGCTLFKLLTGSAPFADEQHKSAFAKMNAHVNTEAPLVSDLRDDIPPAIERLVQDLLQKSPSDRPTKPAEVATELAKFTRGHNLPKLIEEAKELSPSPSVPRSSTLRPVAKPLLRRAIPAWSAIAAGLLGIGLGICLGILIKIKYPDGTEQTIEVPTGSRVTTEYIQDGKPASKANAKQSEKASSSITYSEFGPQPLAMGIVITKEEATTTPIFPRGDIKTAMAALDAAYFPAAVPDSDLAWFPAPNLQDGSIYSARRNGQAFVLVRLDKEHFIPWQEFRQNTSAMSSARHPMLLQFEDGLSNRIQEFTTKNLDRRLAIVINSEVIFTPRISAPFSDRASLTGDIPLHARRKLFDALNGINDPLSQHSGAEGTHEVAEQEEAELGYQPLAMGIAATTLSTAESDAVAQSIAAWKNAATRFPAQVPNTNLVWFPAPNLENIPEGVGQAEIGAGQKCVLLRTASMEFLSWKDLRGSISAQFEAPAGEKQLTLEFHNGLDQRVFKLTEKHQGDHLAVVIDNQVVCVPKINSPISNRAVLQGNYKQESMMRLFEAMNGLMNSPNKNAEKAKLPLPSASTRSFAEDLWAMMANSRLAEARKYFEQLTKKQQHDLRAVLTEEEHAKLSDATAVLSEKQRLLVTLADALSARNGGKPRSDASWLGNSDDVLAALASLSMPKGVKKVQRLAADDSPAWLGQDSPRLNQVAYSFEVDWQQFVFKDLQPLVDEFAGAVGFFDELVSALATDPSGPKLDLQKVLPLLRPKLIVVAYQKRNSPQSSDSWLFAFQAKDLKTLQALVNDAFKHEPDRGFIFLDKWLLIGNPKSIVYAEQAWKEASLRESEDKLQAIGLAFHNFEKAYKILPGTAGTRSLDAIRKEYKPYSWRVALLPFLGEHDLYSQYRFDEEWDSKHNLKLLDRMPEAYRSPSSSKEEIENGQTHFMGVKARHSVLGESDGCRFRDITDGTSNTLLVLELECEVEWTKPQDYPADKDSDFGSLPVARNKMLRVLMADGEVKQVDGGNSKLLQKLATRDGGEELPEDF